MFAIPYLLNYKKFLTMKRLLLAAIALLGTVGLSAQTLTFGPKIGLNISNVSIRDISGYAVENPMKAGYLVGLFGEYRLDATPIAVQAEVVYSSQGTRLRFNDGAMGRARFNFINVPIIGKFYLLPNFSFNGGLQTGFLVGKELKGRATTMRHDISYHAVDLGLLLGMSYNFPIGLMIDLRYDIGLTNVVKKYDNRGVKSKNGILQISAGWRF